MSSEQHESVRTSAIAHNISLAEFTWIWNQYQHLETPRLHIEMACWLSERSSSSDRQLLLLAFRNSGKSTLVGLFCAWQLLQNPNFRILVLAADFCLARKMVRNVKRIIERHPFTSQLRPKQIDQWAADQFTIQRSVELRDPSMLAKGIGANITGLRADMIVCDDVEVPNTCDTPTKRAALKERLQELDYVIEPAGIILYIGTPHTHDSIYIRNAERDNEESIPFLYNYSRLEIPLLDDNNNSRWPERFPNSKVHEIRRNSGPNKFNSQMLLIPVNTRDARLDVNLLKIYDDELKYHEGNCISRLYVNNKRLVSASCWWDPAFGSHDGGDASVVACVFTNEDGEYWLHDIQYLNRTSSAPKSIDTATTMCRDVIDFVETNYLPSVTIETNGIGKFLPGLLRRELHSSDTQCAVVEHVSTKNKDLRILNAFDAVLASGRLHAHRRVRETPFFNEMREWRPGVKAYDDGLDAVAGCLLSEPVRFPRYRSRNSTEKRRVWTVGGSLHVADSRFDL